MEAKSRAAPGNLARKVISGPTAGTDYDQFGRRREFVDESGGRGEARTGRR
jgi:hypothetical protein